MIRKLKHMLAKRRATEDIVRMYSGVASEHDRQRIGDWRKESAQYQQTFSTTNDALADLRGLEQDPDIAALLGDTGVSGNTAKSEVTSSSSNWPKFAAAAVLLVAGWLGYSNWFVQDTVSTISPELSRYLTRIGEQKQITLTDGTRIAMNTGTSMLVEMDENTRRVILERGEAFFEVAKDPQRPFTVELEDHAVTVLGTRFNIRVTPTDYTLALVEGAVALHKDHESVMPDAPILSGPEKRPVKADAERQYRVFAGSVVQYNQKQRLLLVQTDPGIDSYQNWRNGILRFDAVPLKTLVKELNRYTGKKILIEETDIMDLKVYATVRIDRINLALEDLERTLPVDVVQHFDRVVIRSSKAVAE